MRLPFFPRIPILLNPRMALSTSPCTLTRAPAGKLFSTNAEAQPAGADERATLERNPTRKKGYPLSGTYTQCPGVLPGPRMPRLIARTFTHLSAAAARRAGKVRPSEHPASAGRGIVDITAA